LQSLFTPDLRLLAEEMDPLEYLTRSRPSGGEPLAEQRIFALQICQSQLKIESP
jgi:hypothetical protein